ERNAADELEKLQRFTRDTGHDHVAEELEKIVREEREQHELICLGTAGRDLPKMAGWEYSWHYLGAAADKRPEPGNARGAVTRALGVERRPQAFYMDVAESSPDEGVRSFAAEMAADEQRHIVRLETLLAREPDPSFVPQDEAETKPLA